MSTRIIEVSSTDDLIDVRDVIAKVEELEPTVDEDDQDNYDVDDAAEYATLTSLLSELRGNGGDEQWRGDWYPITMIRDTYFTRYAEELAEDIGAVNSDATWPNNHIDWEAAADQLKDDYTLIDYEDATYYVR